MGFGFVSFLVSSLYSSNSDMIVVFVLSKDLLLSNRAASKMSKWFLISGIVFLGISNIESKDVPSIDVDSNIKEGK